MPGKNISMHELFRDAEKAAKVISEVIEPREPTTAAD
jgi:hypothetical protein